MIMNEKIKDNSEKISKITEKINDIDYAFKSLDLIDKDRLVRLENKVDIMDEKLDATSLRVVELGTKMDLHISQVNEHIKADSRIAETFRPLIPMMDDLKSIVKDRNYQTRKKSESSSDLKLMSIRVGMLTAILGILLGFFRIFS